MTDGPHVLLRWEATMRTLDRSRLLPVLLAGSLGSRLAVGQEPGADARCRAWLQVPVPADAAAWRARLSEASTAAADGIVGGP